MCSLLSCPAWGFQEHLVAPGLSWAVLAPVASPPPHRGAASLALPAGDFYFPRFFPHIPSPGCLQLNFPCRTGRKTRPGRSQLQSSRSLFALGYPRDGMELPGAAPGDRSVINRYHRPHIARAQRQVKDPPPLPASPAAPGKTKTDTLPLEC